MQKKFLMQHVLEFQERVANEGGRPKSLNRRALGEFATYQESNDAEAPKTP